MFGVPCRLNKVLAKSIREALPSLRQALEKALEKKRKESRVYGEVRCGWCRSEKILGAA